MSDLIIDYPRPESSGDAAMWRLREVESGVEAYFPPGVYELQVREMDAQGTSPWSEAFEVTYIPEPSAGLLLVAGLVGLAVLARFR